MPPMPSPVGHALAAVAVHAALSPRLVPFPDRRSVAVVVTAALAPDLDLLWRFVDGRNHHQAESHSIGAAALAALVVWALARSRRWPRPAGLGLLAGMGWLSHLFLDYLGRDTHPPIGLMVFWPFSSAYFKFPWPLFLDIGRTLAWETLRNNALAVAWEVVLLLPVTLWVVWRRFQEH
jgi:membrane-bound metal-dependent hydrolase YbcI (DUF457 family)